jgi:hypothetical protein
MVVDECWSLGRWSRPLSPGKPSWTATSRAKAGRYRGLFVGAALLVSVAACGPADHQSAPTVSREVRDGTGVVSVQEPLWDGVYAEATTERTIPAFSSDTASFLFRVNGVATLSDGSLVVANAGTHALLWFGPTGRLVRSVGRQGDGPGEFRTMTWVSTCGPDNVAVGGYDKISLFDSAGTFISSRRQNPRPGDGGLWARGVSADCEKALFTAVRQPETPSAGKVSSLDMTFFWEARDGSRDTIQTGVAWTQQFGGTLTGDLVPLALPWAKMAFWARSGDDVFIAAGGPEVERYAPTGEIVERYSWSPTRRPITDQDRQLYNRARRRYLEDKPAFQAEIIADLDLAPISRDLPFYAGLLVDPTGNVWLRRYPREAAGRMDIRSWSTEGQAEQWAVIPKQGGTIARVRLPVGHSLISVQDRNLLAVARDALDRESIVVLSISGEFRRWVGTQDAPSNGRPR